MTTRVISKDGKHAAAYDLIAGRFQVCFTYGPDNKPFEYCYEVKHYKTKSGLDAAIKGYFAQQRTEAA